MSQQDRPQRRGKPALVLGGPALPFQRGKGQLGRDWQRRVVDLPIPNRRGKGSQRSGLHIGNNEIAPGGIEANIGRLFETLGEKRRLFSGTRNAPYTACLPRRDEQPAEMVPE